MRKRAYNWMTKYAEHPQAIWILAAISFAESSFFPLPPDILYFLLLIANPHKRWRLAFICTASSILGGILGYYIGYAFYETLGKKIIDYYHMVDAFHRFQKDANEWGLWVFVLKVFIPVPFKIITIASGAISLNLKTFILGSIIARSIRFYVIAFIARVMGDNAKDFIEKNIMWLALLMIVTLIGGFFLVKYFGHVQHFFITLVQSVIKSSDSIAPAGY